MDTLVIPAMTAQQWLLHGSGQQEAGAWLEQEATTHRVMRQLTSCLQALLLPLGEKQNLGFSAGVREGKSPGQYHTIGQVTFL